MLKKTKKHIANAIALTILTGIGSSATPVSAVENIKNEVVKSNSQKIENIKVTAKSRKGNHDENLAIDGDVSTYWESENHYRWVELELDGIYDLSEIKIFNKQGGYYKYNIYASEDGENFKKVAYKDNNNIATENGDSHNIENVRACKIRVDVTFSSTQNDSNIAEIELFGEKIDNNLPSETKIDVTDFNQTKWGEEFEKVNSDKVYADEKTIKEMSSMVQRVIGEDYKDKFIFEVRKETWSGNDVFEIEDSKDGKIIIRGNDGVSLASGFNHYLKNYAKVMYNPLMASNLNMPETLPKVGEKIVVDTPYKNRYSLNFCTYSYTMSFWDWDEYEAFLDWSAMNGYNLVLDIIGQEEVLRRTLNEFGYTDEEVKEFISGPAYFAWFYMQNMTSFGGPLPNNWFEERVELGRKMHDRMQTLGIDPVLQGYSGMVPLNFKEKNSDAQILPQGDWCGFDRPNMLKTFVNEGERDYFKEVADVFYQKQKEVFGDVTDYYAVDPFHEGGNTGGLNDGKIYGTIQSKMIEHDEDAIWVIQHWQGNPSNSKINGLVNKEQALILDLNSDLRTNDYKRFEELDVPWVWNMLHNFGGRMGLDGQPERIANNIPAAFAESKQMKGIGITPEAINNSPIVYELIGDMIWTRDKVDFRKWINEYIERRYGKENDDIKKAWEILLETAYQKRDDYYQGAAESVINSRPSMRIDSASTWGNNKIPYDKKELEKAVELFISAYDDLKESDAFIYDFVDVTKQLLANSSQEFHKEMVNAYNQKDLEQFNKISNHFLDLIKLQEKVLSTTPEFLVGTWIQQARTMLEDGDDWTKDLFEFNARALITTWGDYKNTSLKDYSNRQWAGLTGDLYLQRWQLWIDGLRSELETGQKAPNIDWHKIEYEWATRKSTDTNSYQTTAQVTDLKGLANKAMEDFSVTNMKNIVGDGTQTGDRVNIALGKKVISNVETNPEYPEINLTDGNTGTAWMAQNITWPVELTLDLEGKKSINGIQFAPNQAAGGFPITYRVDVLNDGKWITVASQDEGTITGTINIDYKGNAQKVRINLDSKDTNLIPELREIMVYEDEKPKVQYENVALGKPVTGTSSEGGKPLSNITDGKEDTLWVADGGKIPAYANIDLTKSEYIENVELIFEKSGLPFKFKVETIDSIGNTKIILDKTHNNEELDIKYTIPVDEEITNIIVTITGKAAVGSAQGAWPAIAQVKANRKLEMSEDLLSEAIAQINMKAFATSEHPNVGTEGLASFAIDGKENTIWHTKYSPVEPLPQSITLDLGGTHKINKYTYLPRQAGGKNGIITKYELHISEDGENFTKIAQGNWNNDTTLKTLNFEATNASHVKLVALEGVGGFATASELNVFKIPENLAIKETTKVSATSNNEDIENIRDGNLDTLWVANKDEEKVVIFDLEIDSDISGINLISSTSEALKYKVESSSDNSNWSVLINNLDNETKYNKYTNIFEQNKIGRYLKFTFENDDVRINDINIFKANATKELSEYIAKIQKIYDEAIVGEYAGNYTTESKEQLNTALEKAKKAVADGVSSAKVKEEIQILKNELNEFYKGYIVINRTKLGSLINDVEFVINKMNSRKLNKLSLEQRNIIELEIERLKIQKNNAIEIYEKALVSQKEIDNSYEVLKISLEGYLDVLDAKDEFDIVLELAKSKSKEAIVGNDIGQYPKESLDKFKEEIKNAENQFEKVEQKEELDKIIQNLKDAINAFEESKNTEEVKIIVSKPTKFKGTSQANRVNLTWEKPKDDTGLVSYVLYKDGKEIEILQPNENSIEISNLKANTLYAFKLTSKYSNGIESKPVSINIRTKK